MKQHKEGHFYLYNSQYTIEREKLLKQKVAEHIKENPLFYLKTRIYTFFRFWFTGINPDKLKEANSLRSRIMIIYPFAVTVVFILGGLLLLCFFLFKKIISLKEYFLVFCFLLYFDIVHLPFTVQARYSVPAHLLILFLLAISFGNILLGKISFKTKEVLGS
jgi:hypothetical protein